MIRALINSINTLFSLYYLVILVRCFLSFIPNLDWYKQPFCTVKMITDPYLDLFRRIIPPVGIFDISPIVAIIALGLIQSVVVNLLIIIAGATVL